MIPLLLLAALPFTALWIWAIVDCVRYENDDPQTRQRWLLIIIFFSTPGALLYLFTRKARRTKRLPENARGHQGTGDAPRSIFVPRRK